MFTRFLRRVIRKINVRNGHCSDDGSGSGGGHCS